MSNFSIQVQFDQNGLQQFLSAGWSVGFNQQVQGGQPVSWIAFRPMQNNQVDWQEQYSIYVSNTQLMAGALIQVMTQMPAQPGNVYSFENGMFGPPQPGPSGGFGIRNGSSAPGQLAGGITLQGNVNGMTLGGPITAAPLPPQFQQVFTPQNVVEVFAFPNGRGGVFMPPMAGSPLTVAMGGNPSQTIHWDSTQQRFVPGPLS